LEQGSKLSEINPHIILPTTKTLNKALVKAAKNNHLYLVKLLIEHGANNLREALTNSRDEVTDYLKTLFSQNITHG